MDGKDGSREGKKQAGQYIVVVDAAGLQAVITGTRLFDIMKFNTDKGLNGLSVEGGKHIIADRLKN